MTWYPKIDLSKG